MGVTKHSGWLAGEPMTGFDRAIVAAWVAVVVGSGIALALITTGYGASALKVLGAVLGALVVAIIYFAPIFVATLGRHPLIAPIAVINVFLGFTFVGWVVALALAVWPTKPLEVRHD
jgi:hypothetical protein